MRYGSGAQLPRYKEGANRGAGDRQGQGGQADAGGARGLEYSLGIRRYKTLNTRRIQLWTAVTAICDRYRCTYSDVDIKCSSITDNQSLKLSTVYSSLLVDFHKLLGHLFRRHLVYSSFVYHTAMNCLAEKGISLPPCAPVQQGQRGQPPPLPPRFRRPWVQNSRCALTRRAAVLNICSISW